MNAVKEKSNFTPKQLEILERSGRGIKAQLDSHYEQWQSGLSFRIIFPKYSVRANSIDMDIGDFSMALEELGYIKILSTPNGKRTVFSGSCPMSNDELKAHLQEAEMVEAAEKAANKLHR